MPKEIAIWLSLSGAATLALAALLSALLIVILRPLILVRYTLARPNARFSHPIPTPQGGGMAVVAATIDGFSAAGYFSQPARC
jgi:UDP-N-acetylmuramyl pentapeptide phosphotransferase/UDP-N-acetylglucosamine-1-phosphate transferase